MSWPLVIKILFGIVVALLTRPTARDLLKDVWYRNRHEARMAQLEYDRARRASRKSL